MAKKEKEKKRKNTATDTAQQTATHHNNRTIQSVHEMNTKTAVNQTSALRLLEFTRPSSSPSHTPRA